MSTKNFAAAWEKPISKDVWKKFLSHNFSGADRPVAYGAIRDFIVSNRVKAPFSFAEIGFGQCYDFVHCFKEMHDYERIEYYGLDITEQFANYAKDEYEGYDFNVGGFDSLKPGSFDIVYTAKTLEHQPPEAYEQCLRSLLNASRSLCVIIWFKAPAEKERMHWCQRDGFAHEGAWGNTYSKEKVGAIIKDCGFSVKDIPVVGTRHVYVMERKAA